MRSLVAVLLAAAFAAPAGAAISREDLKKALDANPDLLVDALRRADKTKLFEIIVEAQQEFQRRKQKEEEERENKERDEAFKNPLKPDLSNAHLRGSSKAPVTIVEYSDFQCPYCRRGAQNVDLLRKKYGDKVRVAFKHLPLSFHPLAQPAAEAFEAIAEKSEEKAWTFHDKLFENQEKLSEDYIKELVKELGLDPAKIAEAGKSDKIQRKIKADVEEAKKFEIEGTPAYLINGVPLRGAYPVQAFDQIIERHLSEKKG